MNDDLRAFIQSQNEARRKFSKHFIRDFDRRRDDGEHIDVAFTHAAAYAMALLHHKEQELLVQSIRREA